MDGRKNNKGIKGNKGGGRKSKLEEETSRDRIKRALNLLYNKQEDEENITLFLKEFAKTKDGMKLFAEHLLGKPAKNINANFGTTKADLQSIFPDV